MSGERVSGQSKSSLRANSSANPALGVCNIASMLSPKGKPGKGGLRVGTKGTDGEGQGWEGKQQPGSCQPSWEGEELDVGYPRQEIGVFH